MDFQLTDNLNMTAQSLQYTTSVRTLYQ